MILRVGQHGRIAGRSRWRGLTLIELVVTIAVMAVIMLGVGSAMLIVSHAVPTADNPAGAAIAAGQVADEIATELQYAVSIVDSTATTIEFTVGDRDGNDVPETIRYAWSGTPGDPLTRQYNGSAAFAVLPDVGQFDLSYDVKTVTTEVQSSSESGETALSSYSETENVGDFDVESDEWYAQYFLPSLPGDAISWKVTRVQFRAKTYATSTGESRVQLRFATAGGYPSESVLEEKTLLESTLTSGYTLQEFSFSSVSELAPDQGLCLVFKWIANGTACRIQGDTEASDLPDGHLLRSTDGGSSWTVRSSDSLLYWVYGTVTTPGDPEIETTYYLGGATLTVQAGDDERTVVRTGVGLLNEPEVTP